MATESKLNTKPTAISDEEREDIIFVCEKLFGRRGYKMSDHELMSARWDMEREIEDEAWEIAEGAEVYFDEEKSQQNKEEREHRMLFRKWQAEWNKYFIYPAPKDEDEKDRVVREEQS